MSQLKDLFMQDAYDDLRSSTSASPKDCKLLGQRKSDRYNEVLRDAIIDPRDHDFARPEQTAGLNIVNPYSALRGSSVSNDVTFSELNAHCPSANRPSFHAEGKKLDKLPNTNGLAGIARFTIPSTSRAFVTYCAAVASSTNF